MKITQANGKTFEDFEVVKDLIAQRLSFSLTEVTGINGTLNLLKKEIENSKLTYRVFTGHKSIFMLVALAAILFLVILGIQLVVVAADYIYVNINHDIQIYVYGISHNTLIAISTISGGGIALILGRLLFSYLNINYEIIKNPITKSIEVLFKK